MRYYNDNYVVNEQGELFSLFGLKIRKLKPYKNKCGYLMYRLRIDGKTIHKSAHHLSYWVNVGHFDTSDGLQIDHIDGNKLNNHYKNLRRVTHKDNVNNINTVGNLTRMSRSNYRITDNYMLPKEYIKDKKYDPNKHFIDITNNCKEKRKKGYKSLYKKLHKCDGCDGFTSGKLCVACYKKERTINIPSKEELVKDIMSKKPIVKLASKYGVSDNAYRKWLKKRGLPFRLKEIKSFIMGV